VAAIRSLGRKCHKCHLESGGARRMVTPDPACSGGMYWHTHCAASSRTTLAVMRDGGKRLLACVVVVLAVLNV